MADFEENVEEMVGMTREAAAGDRVRGDETGDENGGDETRDETGGPGGPRDQTGDKTAATAGDKRDGCDRWGNVYGRRGVGI